MTFIAALTAYGEGSVALGAPTGTTTGDFQVVFIEAGSSASVITTATSGWFRLLSSVKPSGSGGSARSELWYKQSAGASEGTVTWSDSAGRTLRGIRATYRSVSEIMRFLVTADTGNTGTPATPSLTTSVDGCTILGFVGTDATARPTYTPPAGWTERIDDAVGGTETVGVTMAEFDQTSAGAISGTFTSTSSDSFSTWIVALRPSGVYLSPPQNLTATPASETQVNLAWDAVVGAEFYEVEQDGVIVASSVATTSYAATGLTVGTTYSWRVRCAATAPSVSTFWSATSPIRKPVAASPTLDTNSTSIVSYLSGSFDDPGGVGIPGVSIVAYGSPIYFATGATPRFATDDSGGSVSDFRVMNAPSWGPNPLNGLTIPVDPSWVPSTGFPAEAGYPLAGDNAMIIIDTDGRVFGIYHFNRTGADVPYCDWCGWQWATTVTDTITDQPGGDSTGAGFSRLAGVVRREELQAGQINHALVFATRFARPTTVISPAKKTDGAYLHGGGVGATASNSIPEAQRIYLDPTINLSAISGITSFELMIGEALQTYGAYCIDNTGSSTGFQIICETPPDPSDYSANGSWDHTITDSIYNSVGVTSEYPDMSHIPWTSLRVIESANWDSGN